MPPARIETAPPITPEPPRVPPASTVTAPPAADWSPLISSVPLETVVAPE